MPSYGLRPGRSPHDAIRALNGPAHLGKVSSIHEAAVVRRIFDDYGSHKDLSEMRQIRVANGSLRLLVGKSAPRWSAGRSGDDGARIGNHRKRQDSRRCWGT